MVAKSLVTQKKIVDAAISLFEEEGYDKATMRAIAKRAEVSVGNAYYYFPSKEALVQGYYEQLQASFHERIEPVLARETKFPDRLTAVMEQWIENARPYHDFAAAFFRTAANPKSSLSPFSPESQPTREQSIGVFRQVVDQSVALKASPELRAQLPEMLWLFHMGIVLFWVFDDSPDQQRTLELIRKTVPVISRLIGMSRLPGLRNTANEMVALFTNLSGRNAARD